MASTGVVRAQQRSSRTVWWLLVLLCVIGAGAALRRMVLLANPSVATATAANPAAMLDQAFARKRALTYAHLVPALVFVVTIPIAFSRRIREASSLRKQRVFAIWCLSGALAGATALRMVSAFPIGGVSEVSATVFWDAVFLFSLVRAVWWRNDAEKQRQWMIRATCVALGIATTRPIMGIFFATSRLTGLTAHDFFGTAFWIGFSLNYVVTEAYLRRRTRLIPPVV
jgi:hypothetical protein